MNCLHDFVPANSLQTCQLHSDLKLTSPYLLQPAWVKIVCTCPTTHSTAHSHSYYTGVPLRRLWCAKENSFSTFSIAPTHIQKGKVSGIHCAHMSFFYQVVLLNKLKSFLISHQLIKIHQILAKPHNKNACFTFEGSYKILFS